MKLVTAPSSVRDASLAWVRVTDAFLSTFNPYMLAMSQEITLRDMPVSGRASMVVGSSLLDNLLLTPINVVHLLDSLLETSLMYSEIMMLKW